MSKFVEEVWYRVGGDVKKPQTPFLVDETSTGGKRYRTVKHEWDGFNHSGCENWYIVFPNGNRISSQDDKYQTLLDRYSLI